VREARRLYALHIGVAILAVGLIGGTASIVLLASDLSPPSPGAISEACANWVGSGGLGAVLGLLVIGLTAVVLFLAVRSAVRHVRAGRAYVSGLPQRGTFTVDELPCRRVEVVEPLAFCAGYLRPRIYLSSELIERLSEEQ
jgi:hypothetical protein